MAGVLFLGRGITVVAIIPVWAVETFVTHTNDALGSAVSVIRHHWTRRTNLVALVADGGMLNVVAD